jgi:hypothetical protein
MSPVFQEKLEIQGLGLRIFIKNRPMAQILAVGRFFCW